MTPDSRPTAFDHSLVLESPPVKVMAAFFDPRALYGWWDVVASVATPRVLGPYALQWDVSSDEDEVFGRLGGVLHGTVIDYQPASGFFVGDSYWLPPDGDPVGPMALEVSCRSTPGRGDGPATLLRVRQSGVDDSARWQHYYEVIGATWPRAFERLKDYLERGQGIWDLRSY